MSCAIVTDNLMNLTCIAYILVRCTQMNVREKDDCCTVDSKIVGKHMCKIICLGILCMHMTLVSGSSFLPHQITVLFILALLFE